MNILAKDVSDEILQELLKSPNELPDRYNLKQFLKDPPNVKIPLIYSLFNSIPTVDLLSGIISLHKTGETEDSYHSFWDDVIKKSFEIFGINLKSMEFDCNTNNNTCSGRLLPMILDLCPKRDNPEFQVLNRLNGNVVEIGYTVKKIFLKEQDANHLKHIYKILKDNEIRCVDELFASHGKSVHLKPCGDERKPSDFNGLLRALTYIRWPNIILHNEIYILIDFEFAEFAPQVALNQLKENDMRLKYLSNLASKLCEDDLNRRPSASDALEKIKEMFKKWYPLDKWLEYFENSLNNILANQTSCLKY
ncbi:1833_t:CDS:2 [Entrophospora sp. SA101]|nr:1833_t:CDS:2 [Entrophospora sp. SA101]CAJ0883312.1 14737_t:CDS:2 [Entrophospora sp. SA101]CAJ0921162.1 2961_t:CDS:2 [Entrophospora sp. SA101]